MEGKSLDIHDVTVRNVTSSTHGCSLVRLLACDGAREYNIDISDLHDTGKSISGCGAILGVGSDTFAPVRNHTADEFFNITIRNLTTCAQEAIRICEPCKNILIENVSTFGTPLIGMTYSKNFRAENFVIRNFNFCTNETETDSLITARCDEEAMQGLRLEDVRCEGVKVLLRGVSKEIEGLELTKEPSESMFSEEIPELPHPYGRYHRYFHDVPIKNRPADSRWANECYEI